VAAHHHARKAMQGIRKAQGQRIRRKKIGYCIEALKTKNSVSPRDLHGPPTDKDYSQQHQQ